MPVLFASLRNPRVGVRGSRSGTKFRARVTVCLYVCSKCGPLGTGYLRYWALVTRYSVLGTRHSQSSHGYYRVQASRIYARRHLMTLSKHSPSWQAASKCGSCSSAGCSGAIPPSLHTLSTGPWGRCVRPQSLCD